MSKESGFSLIELIIVVLIIGIVATIAIPNLLATRRNANEASAISSSRAIVSAQITYQSSTGKGEFGNLVALGRAGLVDSVLGRSATSMKSGYMFTATPTLRGDNNGLAIFDLTAVPSIFGATMSGTGSRSFYSNEVGVIYFNQSPNAPAAVSSTFRNVTGGKVVD